MNDRNSELGISISISAVERDTGLSKDTLRVWERRYGFPQPLRDAFGERVYPLDQVDKLRVLKRLIDQGHRPGKVIGFSIEQLQQLVGASAAAAARSAASLPSQEDLQQYLELVKAHDIDELRRRLSQAVLRAGLIRFVIDIAAPLSDQVDDAWMRGYFEVFEERLYTESIQVVLRNAINLIPRNGDRPRLLLTTFPQESHGAGLLMAEAIFALEGCRCISLGVQTPVRDIVMACLSQHADIVALSFSNSANPNQVTGSLEELRAKLPPLVEVWASGAGSALYRRPPRDVRTFRSLSEIPLAVARWRAARRVG